MPYPILSNAQNFTSPPPERLGYNLEGIGEFLSQHSHLRIPNHQRTFAWKKEHADDFWSDISTAISEAVDRNERSADYFLGSIVTTPDEEREQGLCIIDGQQRLVSVSLLFVVIRDKLLALGEGQQVAELARFLGDYEYADRVWEFRLTLEPGLSDFFQSRLLEHPTERELELPVDTEPKARMIEVFDTFSEHVDQFVEAQGGDDEAKRALAILWRFLERNVRILALRASSDANAYMIFETLNDRGADLTTFDLLKNLLFSRAASSGERRLNQVVTLWDEASANLEVEEDERTQFLRRHWSSLYGHTTERKLYKEMKDHLRDQGEVLPYARKLVSGAEVYSAAERPGHEFWQDMRGRRESCTKSIRHLIDLEATQMRPLLLAIMEEWRGSPAQIESALVTLISWHVRLLVAGEAGSGSAEKLYCSMALAVRQGAGEDAIENADELRADAGAAEKIPDDARFREQFGIYAVSPSKPKIARYILAALEGEKTGQELEVNRDTGVVNLEHILPKKPKEDEWRAFPIPDRKDFLNRIGNLTLLSSDDNPVISNSEYADKVAAYAASSLEITRAIPEDYPDDWNPETLNARQASLAQVAVDVWPK
jgi:hypothetical protein